MLDFYEINPISRLVGSPYKDIEGVRQDILSKNPIFIPQKKKEEEPPRKNAQRSNSMAIKDVKKALGFQLSKVSANNKEKKAHPLHKRNTTTVSPEMKSESRMLTENPNDNMPNLNNVKDNIDYSECSSSAMCGFEFPENNLGSVPQTITQDET